MSLWYSSIMVCDSLSGSMPSSFALLMILSSTSVKLVTWLTSYPLCLRYLAMTSKLMADFAWPRCDWSYTVTPQTYMPTFPSASGSNGSFFLVSVLYKTSAMGYHASNIQADIKDSP